jgi:Virulence-associated protein E
MSKVHAQAAAKKELDAAEAFAAQPAVQKYAGPRKVAELRVAKARDAMTAADNLPPDPLPIVAVVPPPPPVRPPRITPTQIRKPTAEPIPVSAGTVPPPPPTSMEAKPVSESDIDQVVLAGEYTKTKAGIIHGTVRNAVMYLMGIPWMSEVFFDEFSQRIFYQGQEWSPRNETPQLLAVQTSIPAMSPATFAAAIEAIALANRRDRLQDWIAALPKWDGKKRLSLWLTSAFACPSDRYHIRVGRNWLISMTARARKPACKVDTMPVLEGLQGKLKSTALEALAEPFFIEAPGVNFGDKDFLMGLQGAWLVEMPELSALRNADVNLIKDTLTKKTDRYRAPYDRRPQEHPRRSVFAGTVNSSDYLRDTTGNRRFLPVDCATVNIEWIRENRDMLFAEALHEYERGRKWWHFPKAATEAMQEDRLPGDPWASRIAMWMSANPSRSELTSDDLHVAVGVMSERRTRSTEMRLGSVMVKSFKDWTKARVRTTAGRTYTWRHFSWPNPPPRTVPPPPTSA